MRLQQTYRSFIAAAQKSAGPDRVAKSTETAARDQGRVEYSSAGEAEYI